MADPFPLGETYMTPGARDKLHPEDVLLSLARHQRGDWGNVDDEDKRLNDRAVKDGTRLLSSYTDRNQTKFWIITEADRSATTILLPSEY